MRNTCKVSVSVWFIVAFTAVLHTSSTTAQSTAKPNFIVIITDDQGWDDIGLHNPKYINTPNLDKFIQQSTFFDNFYVTPQCAQTRAALLTGRAYPKTGTVLVNGGYDFISRDEATAGAVMQSAGYQTLQFGKWHNKQVLGYEPWNVGFESGQIPSSTAEMVHVNGTYEDLGGKEFEFEMMNQLIAYLGEKAAAAAAAAAGKMAGKSQQKPFFVYYATHAIHVQPSKSPNSGGVKKARVYPDLYRAKYHDNPKYKGINQDTLDAWATLEYLDAQLGRLFEQLKASGLDKTTYVMIMSDNGSALMKREDRKLRLPSGMAGNKSSVFEGGIRNFLAVQGPSVPPGVIDSTLLDITDVLPTIADLAGLKPTSVKHKPWDGISFKNLLVAAGSNAAVQQPQQQQQQQRSRVVRGTHLANQQQLDRFLVILGPQCWDPNAVPTLGQYSREVVRPQPLLNYYAGGMRNTIHGKEMPGLDPNRKGFEPCMAVRHKNYKWIGATGKVYRFDDSAHLENPQTEVPEPTASEIRSLLSNAAKSWWDDVIAEPNSFAKPTFCLGLGKWSVTNVVASGAHERTFASIRLRAMGAQGFTNIGDRMCFKLQVLTAGSYNVVTMYSSNIEATFKLSVGPYSSITNGTAPRITVRLPALAKMRGMDMGSLTLPTSVPNSNPEACLELMHSSKPGTSVFKSLANLRFTKTRIQTPPTHRTQEKHEGHRTSFTAEMVDATVAVPAVNPNIEAIRAHSAPAAAAMQRSSSSSGGGFGSRLPESVSRLSAATSKGQTQFKTAEAAALFPRSSSSGSGSHWELLRQQQLLVDGQGGIAESLFSPYDTEDMDTIR